MEQRRRRRRRRKRRRRKRVRVKMRRTTVEKHVTEKSYISHELHDTLTIGLHFEQAVGFALIAANLDE